MHDPPSFPKAASYAAVPIFVLTIALLRSPSFFFSSAGLDEGLYFLMARDLLHGYLPYTHTFDNKPPGIYLLFAGAQVLFGQTPLAIRLASCLAIAAGAFALYRLCWVATGGRRDAALVASFGYLLFTSHVSGLEANTEIFFMPLVAGALALVWPADGSASRRSLSASLLAGLMLGAGICIKESVLYDAIAALVAMFAFGPRRQFLAGAAALTAGIALPIVAVPVWFAAAGGLDVLYRATFEANLRRAGLGISAGENLARILKTFVTLFPLPELTLLAPLYLRFERNAVLRRAVSFALIWLAIDAFGALSLGVFEAHWILPLLLPMLLLGAILLVSGVELLTSSPAARRRLLATALILAGVVQVAKPLALAAQVALERKRGDPAYADRVSAIVDFISTRAGADDCIFVVTPESAFEYALAGTQVPTAYGFSYFLTNEYGVRISGADVPAEVRRAFRCKPKLVVLQVPVNKHDLEPRFYAIANGAASTSGPDATEPASFASWLRVVELAKAEMGDAYGEPVPVGGALIFERKAAIRS